MDGVLFKETQRFSSNRWLWIILLIITGTSIVVNSGVTMDYPGILSDIGISVIILLIVMLLKLETQIYADGFYYRYPLLIWKQRRIGLDEIEKAYIRKYSPLGEYGGWGYRGIGKDKAYNVSGNMGIQLILKDGRKILFGTKRPEEVQAVLEKIGFGH